MSREREQIARQAGQVAGDRPDTLRPLHLWLELDGLHIVDRNGRERVFGETGKQLKPQPLAGPPPGGGETATHNLLSPTHADTVGASALRGDLLVANATPAWTRLAKGTANQNLTMNAAGTDPQWTTGGAATSVSLTGLTNLVNDVDFGVAEMVAPAAAEMPGGIRGTQVGQEIRLMAYGLQRALDQTFDQLLRGVLNTKGVAAGTVTFSFNNSSTANIGIATWSGTWTNTVNRRETTTAGNYFEVKFQHSSGNVVIDRGTGSPVDPDTGNTFTNAAKVSLDGGAESNWDQGLAQTFTLTGVAAGVHVVKVRHGGVTGDEMAIASFKPQQLPYQGVGVQGDEVELLHVAPWLFVTTIGTGPTDNGGTYNRDAHGEAITPRLPLGTGNSDTTFTRDSCALAGLTFAGATAVKRYLWTDIRSIAGADSTAWPVQEGSQIWAFGGKRVKLGATAGTRGRAADANIFSVLCPSAAVAAARHISLPAIGRVTALGAGSALALGDLVLVVLVNNINAQAPLFVLVLANDAGRPADFFKLPAGVA